MFTRKDLQRMEQLRRAMQLFAGTLDEPQAREVATLYPQWRPGVRYERETYVTYGEDGNEDPALYRTTQGHTSAGQYPPDTANTLYVRVGIDGSGYPVWSPPAGAHDAYDSGDIVSHGGRLWRSEIDGNTTEPGQDSRWWSVYEEV